MNRAVTGLLLLAFSFLVHGREESPVERTSDVLRQPLSELVTESTMINLIGFAVKDRECRALPQRTPSMHAPIYEDYSDCMYKSNRTACDGAASDFGTLKTLFARDPRLVLLANFDVVAYQLQADCEAQGKPVRLDQVTRWNDDDLQRCSVEPHQPALVAAAVMLKVIVPAGDNVDFLATWSGTCRGVKGIFFLGEHCRKVQSNAKEIHNAYTGAVLPFTRPREFGIEDYLCPMTYDYWKPR
jgi:hypothetical protein